MDRRYRLSGGLAVAACFALVFFAGAAQAGTYRVSSCWANTSFDARTEAPAAATRGMRAVDDCEEGARSVLMGNEVSGGNVSRGAKAEIALDAPAATRFVSIRWSGKAR